MLKINLHKCTIPLATMLLAGTSIYTGKANNSNQTVKTEFKSECYADNVSKDAKTSSNILQIKKNLQQVNPNNINPTPIWSEGAERNIRIIVLPKSENTQADILLHNEMQALGNKLGFTVAHTNTLPAAFNWLEDYGIRRADGKLYILPPLNKCRDIPYNQNTEVNSKISSRIASYANPTTIVKGKSYLEGGDVLNTLNKNGEAAAVIGSATINYSLRSMGLTDTPQNREIVKKQVAEDLGLKLNNVTYIPQFDFHIDMFYRPLKNGEIAIPDYLEAIKILKNTKIANLDIKNKQALINNLTKAYKTYSLCIKKAEEKLTKDGYKLKRIPCFSLPTDMGIKSGINYANGICGKDKNGKYYIITNKSKYKELEEQVVKYFKAAGLDDVYFVSTQEMLDIDGGLDCITQEF